jgi:hypothetical protein
MILRSATGEGFLSMHSKIANEIAASLPKKNRNKILKQLSIHFDDFNGAMMGRFMDGEGGVGTIHKMGRFFMKTVGLEDWTDAARVATIKSLSNILASHATKTWDKLPKRIPHNFKRYGIMAEDWPKLQEAIGEFADKSRGIVPELIKDDVLRRKYMNYLSDYADLGVPFPSERTKAALTQGTQAGTPEGTLFRVATQFKGYPLAVINTVSRVMSSDPNKKFSGFRNIHKERGDMQNMAALMVSATAMAYMGDSLRQLAKNETPRDPTDPEVMSQMLLRSGTGGLLFDFIGGEYQRSSRSLIGDLAGPGLGEISNIAEIWSKAIRGDDFGGDATQFLIRNTPFNNVFYLKGALDYMFLDEMNEYMNPGFRERSLKRMKEKPGLLTDSVEPIIDTGG